MIQVRGFRMGVAILVGVAFLATGVVQAGGKPLTYPKTKKVDQVDELHGVKVADPYRWLEDPDTPDARAWIEAQNKVTFGLLGEIAARDKIRERLTSVGDYAR